MVVLYPHPAPLKPTSTDAVNRGYWDPEESTRNKWTNDTTHGGYADILEERGLTKDFTGLSTLLLGQAQPAQFQSSDQTGYIWGTIYADNGDGTPNFDQILVTTGEIGVVNGIEYHVDTNANSVLPRTYSSGATHAHYMFYNWYAASAEGLDYSNTRSDTVDSICPSGWKMPACGYNATVDKTFAKLGSSYGASPYSEVRKAPVGLGLDGLYRASSGQIDNYGAIGRLWTTTNYAYGISFNLALLLNSYNPTSANSQAHGFTVRCVKK